MKRKRTSPIVFFNASVILAGIHSPMGGSAKLLRLVKQKQITGVISEIIFDELLRHADKIKKSKSKLSSIVLEIFPNILPAPSNTSVFKYKYVVLDSGDTHVLASTKDSNAEYLVTLDKKHLLILQNKIKWVKIVSPKELLEKLKNN